MLVKNYIGPSKIHGIGIFAGENIKKGTVIWRFNPIIDRRITKKEVASLPKPAKEFLLKYAYMNKRGDIILCADDARFFNHSKNSNTINNDELGTKDTTIAARDIKKGEEITSDYLSYDHSKKFLIEKK
jgi:hypothetical protein